MDPVPQGTFAHNPRDWRRKALASLPFCIERHRGTRQRATVGNIGKTDKIIRLDMLNGSAGPHHILNGGCECVRKIPGFSLKLENNSSLHKRKGCIIAIRLKEAVFEIRGGRIKSGCDDGEFICLHRVDSTQML